jgi:hypothetical protein
MKCRILLFVFILGVAFVSCEDEIPVTTNLEGTWNWQSFCGGVAGCSYASFTNYKILRITPTHIELKERGKITVSELYSINTVTGDDRAKTYEIELSDGEIWTVWIQNNFLTTEGFPGMRSIYKRI